MFQIMMINISLQSAEVALKCIENHAIWLKSLGDSPNIQRDLNTLRETYKTIRDSIKAEKLHQDIKLKHICATTHSVRSTKPVISTPIQETQLSIPFHVESANNV